MRLAGLIKIRHRCDCPTATEPPGEDGIEHVFTIDGEPFPWYITEAGPRVRLLEGTHQTDPVYGVTVEIVCTEVDAIGLP